MADALLTDGRLDSRGVFDSREVARLWHDHQDGRANHQHRLWQLMMLELWFRQFIDRAPAARAQYAEAI
jgi:asparagine synthase (glutamine-hydrolysing)